MDQRGSLMAIVNDDLADVANTPGADDLLNRPIAGVPRCLVVHEHVNVSFSRDTSDLLRILQRRRQRLFHHDMHATFRASLDGRKMVQRAAVNDNGLRMRLLQHRLGIRKQQGGIELVLLRVFIPHLFVRLRKPNDGDVFVLGQLAHETMQMIVHHPHDGNAKDRLCRLRASHARIC